MGFRVLYRTQRYSVYTNITNPNQKNKSTLTFICGEKIYYKYFHFSQKSVIFIIMKKNRQASFNKLMADRAADMTMLFGDQPPTAVAIERIKGLKGVKRFFYIMMLIVENESSNKDQYRKEFELAMTHWQYDKVSGKHLQDRADQIINEELKVVDPNANAEDYVEYEEV